MANKPLVSLQFPDLTDTYTIPTKTSDLTNDSGFVNASGAASAAPVQSVNGQTGAVTVQAATDAQVSTAVNTWCGNNVAQETGYVLDSTLTMSNAAAPADKVGELKSAFDNILEINGVNISTNLIDNRGMTGKTPEELWELSGSTYVAYIPLEWGENTPEGSFQGYFILNDGTYDYTTLNAILLTLCDSNKTAISGDYNMTQFNGITIAVPYTAKYLKLTMYNWRSYTVVKFGFCKSTYTDFTTTEYSKRLDNTWKGKKWIAYGDSITEQGKYTGYVADSIGLRLTNAGLGGSPVADGSDISVASFTNANRIAALPTDADVVTIMGGTNDFNTTNSGAGSPLGSLPTSATFDTTTFIGALCQTVKLIQNQCPNALIIICGNIGGRGNTGQVSGYQLANSRGLTSVDYAKAAKQVAEYMGVPYIATDECGINPFNRLTYISDSVHPNNAGGELISRPIIAYFETNQPN